MPALKRFLLGAMAELWKQTLGGETSLQPLSRLQPGAGREMMLLMGMPIDKLTLKALSEKDTWQWEILIVSGEPASNQGVVVRCNPRSYSAWQEMLWPSEPSWWQSASPSTPCSMTSLCATFTGN